MTCGPDTQKIWFFFHLRESIIYIQVQQLLTIWFLNDFCHVDK